MTGALYMVYARLDEDEETREWVIDMSPGEAAALDMRFDAIAKGLTSVRLIDYGVTLLVDEGPDNLDEFLADLEREFEEY